MADPEAYSAVDMSEYQRALRRLRATRDATRVLDQQEAEDRFTAPVVRSLSEAIVDPPKPLRRRIECFSYVGANTLVNAQYKAGKTTLAINRVRSLVDREPFLDYFDVRAPVSGSIVYLNYEVGESQMHDWLVAQGIKNAHKVIPINLRGAGAFMQEDVWAEWLIEQLRAAECEVLEFDPLAAGLKGSALSDEVATDFLSRLDRIKSEAGVSDLFLTAHTGHLRNRDSTGRADNERTMGSSRWMGWADAWWTLAKDEDGIRYLSAEGRDIEQPEFSLVYDPTTHHLSVDNLKASRTDASKVRKREKVCAFIAAWPEPEGPPKGEVKAHVGGSSTSGDAFLSQMQADGLIVMTPGGKKNATNCALGPAYTWAGAPVPVPAPRVGEDR